MKRNEALKLLEKYENGTISTEELALLEGWYNHKSATGNAEISDDELEHNLDNIWDALPKEIEQQPKTKRLWWTISAAASILLILATGIYFYSDHGQPVNTASTHDVAPGGNKAYLTLANGKRIILTEASNGVLAKNGGVTVTKAADGQLIYTVASGAKEGLVPQYNTIETPRGGQYQISLPDGTKVWLNAASSLKYPVSFTANERKVELTGEGYFEVSKDKNRPFKVKSKRQEITVLGTHFNINNYDDEPYVTTTLLEGSIRIFNPLSSKNVVLKPKQQAILANHDITVQTANIEEAVAWKTGEFIFNDEQLESIMRKIARWYDVEVIYKGTNQKERFGGTVSRFENISKVLEKLELTGGVKFNIQGGKITVGN